MNFHDIMEDYLLSNFSNLTNLDINFMVDVLENGEIREYYYWDDDSLLDETFVSKYIPATKNFVETEIIEDICSATYITNYYINRSEFLGQKQKGLTR